MELYILAAFLVGILIGNWLGQRKFVANAGHIQRVEYRGRLFKVYDVTGLWHLEDPEYRDACRYHRRKAMNAMRRRQQKG